MDVNLNKVSEFDRLIYETIRARRIMSLGVEENICLYTSMGVNSVLFKNMINGNIKQKHF